MTETNWYDLDEAERIKQVYAKYTIKEFWDFWSDSKPRTMEVRIKDYELIREVAKKFDIPWCSSGVFVNTDIQLKNVIAYVRNKATVWFGAQPRKKNWSPKGWKMFGGKDYNVDEIAFIFIDIDRKVKDGPATKAELKECDIFSDMVIERFKTAEWNKGYLKICSGNGVQLFIKLDVAIKMPLVEFSYNEENGKKIYYHKPNDEYETIRKLITLGVGNEILKFSRKNKKELNVDIDKTSFRVSQVASLPFTKNIKYDGFTWRGIVDLQDGKNVGLSDYILSKESEVDKANFKSIFITTQTPQQKQKLVPGKLMNNEIAKFMVKHKFPDGMINNTIWFQLKALIRDSQYDTNTDEFRKFHATIKKLHGRTFTTNLPEDKFSFSEDIVNAFCIQHGFQPIYKLWPKRTKTSLKKIQKLYWRNREDTLYPAMKLSEETEVLEDFKICKEQFEEDRPMINNGLAISFLKGLINKYGEERAKFYLELFERYFNWD